MFGVVPASLLPNTPDGVAAHVIDREQQNVRSLGGVKCQRRDSGEAKE